MSDSKILEKIKKLMLKQQSAEQIGSMAEAEAFAAKVQQLLAKHNLSLGEVDFSEPDAIGFKTMSSWASPVIAGQSGFDIMYPIAKFNWCRVYFLTKGNKKTNQMKIVGAPENIEVCQYLFKVIVQALIKICKEDYKKMVDNFEPEWDYFKQKETKPIGYDTYARAWFRGAGDGLHKKLRMERDEFKKQNESATGLILYNDKAVGEWVNQNMKISFSKVTHTNKETDAFFKGREAGENVKYAKGVRGKESKTNNEILK